MLLYATVAYMAVAKLNWALPASSATKISACYLAFQDMEKDQ